MDLSKLGASDGAGEAVRANITALRAIGSTTLAVDSLVHWPQKFIATMGTLLSDSTLDPATATVFTGHINGTGIVIDTFAPGYTDKGSKVNDVVVIKPTTNWADMMAAIAISSATGWFSALGTWSYSSYDTTNKTGVITVPTDATTTYSPGMRVKFTNNSAVQYGIIVAVTATTLTIYFGTDYSLTNAAITSPCYSSQQAPLGFPQDPNKWQFTVRDTVRRLSTPPAQLTWYKPTGSTLAITLPVGVWNVNFKANHRVTSSGSTGVWSGATLSETTNTESDPRFTTKFGSDAPSGTITAEGTAAALAPVVVTTTKTLTALHQASASGTLTANCGFNDANGSVTSSIIATCAYL